MSREGGVTAGRTVKDSQTEPGARVQMSDAYPDRERSGYLAQRSNDREGKKRVKINCSGGRLYKKKDQEIGEEGTECVTESGIFKYSERLKKTGRRVTVGTEIAGKKARRREENP